VHSSVIINAKRSSPQFSDLQHNFLFFYFYIVTFSQDNLPFSAQAGSRILDTDIYKILTFEHSRLLFGGYSCKIGRAASNYKTRLVELSSFSPNIAIKGLELVRHRRLQTVH
jgi:hypothetical protein